MVPTTIFSILFNLPKFWELEFEQIIEMNEHGENETFLNLRPSDLRINPDYSFYYVHLIQLFVKGILPFGALLFLNIGIYK